MAIKAKDEILKTKHRQHQTEWKKEPISQNSSRDPKKASSTMRKKKRFQECKKGLTNMKSKFKLLRKRSKNKEREDDKIEAIKRITEGLPISPGPNLMRPRTPRAQDMAYQAILEAAEKERNESKPKTDEEMFEGLVINLAALLKATTKVDIASPPKFKGDDTKRENWYKQLRAYLQAKGWLKTFDLPVGAGATDFDAEINSSICNLLMNLCNNGKASAYLEGAAEFDGRGAGLALLANQIRWIL